MEFISDIKVVGSKELSPESYVFYDSTAIVSSFKIISVIPLVKDPKEISFI